MWGRVNNPLWGLKAPSPQLRNGFSNSAQNLDSETIFKPFGLDGWLKVSYLLDYMNLIRIAVDEMVLNKKAIEHKLRCRCQWFMKSSPERGLRLLMKSMGTDILIESISCHTDYSEQLVT